MAKYLKESKKILLEPTIELVKTKTKIYPDGTKTLFVYKEPKVISTSEGGAKKGVGNTPEPKTDSEREYERLHKFWQVKAKIKDYVLSNDFTHFWNLTQDEKIVGDRHNDEIAMENLSAFLYAARRMAQRKKVKFGYIFIPERHKSGALHFHGFTYGFCGSLKDSGVKWKGKTVFNCKQWKYGFSDVTKIENKVKAANYCTKYVTKDLAEQGLGYGKKKYWSSRGLRLPDVGYSVEDLGEGLQPAWIADDNSVTIYNLDS